MDNYAGTFSALIVGMTEILVVSYVYGVERFLDDIKVMLGFYPFHYVWWKWSWRVITPSLVTVSAERRGTAGGEGEEGWLGCKDD